MRPLVPVIFYWAPNSVGSQAAATYAQPRGVEFKISRVGKIRVVLEWIPFDVRNSLKSVKFGHLAIIPPQMASCTSEEKPWVKKQRVNQAH